MQRYELRESFEKRYRFGEYEETITAHILLMCVAFWAFFDYYLTVNEFRLGHCCFILYFAMGLLSTWKYVNCRGLQVDLKKIQKLYSTTAFLGKLYSLSTLTSDLYLRNNFSKELAYAHLFLPLLALVPYATHLNLYSHWTKEQLPDDEDTLEMITFACAASMSYVSVVSDNISALAAVIVYAFVYFVITDRRRKTLVYAQTPYLYIYGLMGFCVLAAKAVTFQTDVLQMED